MENKTEIAFFDVETTVPTRPGQGYAILEFGAILVCPQKLEEIRSYSTLVRPSNPKLISSLSVRCNGITPEAVVSAPSFADIADTVYDILHGRIWAGHNIVRFDCARIREAFAEIGRAAPEPKGTIDSLPLLTQKFGRRAGNMKMASLATYFGLGNQTHRSLDDVRMNIEVLKHCATVLFLESSFPDAFPKNYWVSPNAMTRSCRNGKSPVLNTNSPSTSSHVKSTPALSPENDRTEEKRPVFSLLTSSTAEAQYSVASNTAHPDTFDMVALGNAMNAASFQPDVAMEENPILQPPEMPSTVNSPSTSSHVKSTPALSPENDRTEERHPVFSLLTSNTAEAQYSVASSTAHPDTFDMVALGNEMNAASFQPDVAMEENPILQPPEIPSTVTVPESCSDVLGFLELDEVSLSSIRAFHVPFFQGSPRIKLFYEGGILQLHCPRLRIRFGLSTKFSDHAGRPRLSFVVDASPSLCDVLDTCESIVWKVCADSDCSSDWRSVVTRKLGFVNNPTVRLNIPTAVNGNVAQYATDMYQKEPSGTTQKLIFSKFDATELDTWFKPGTFVDAYLSLDPYVYQQASGIRLVAKKLIIHNE